MRFAAFFFSSSTCIRLNLLEIYATGFNHKAFTFIKSRATQATKELAVERGEAPDIHGTSKRNTNLLAVAAS